MNVIEGVDDCLPRDVKLFEELEDIKNDKTRTHKVSVGLVDEDDMTYTTWMGKVDFSNEPKQQAGHFSERAYDFNIFVPDDYPIDPPTIIFK